MLNWKLRLKNKATLTTLIVAVIAFIYQLLGIIGIIPAVAQDTLISTCGMAVNILCLLGIVVDPTTKGIGDSERAMRYNEPSNAINEEDISEHLED